TVTSTDTTAGMSLGAPTLSSSQNGIISVTVSTLAVGTHAITASFSGDGNFSSSTDILAGGQTVTTASSVVTWISTTSGDWDTAGNWLDSNKVNRVPTAGDDVVITVPGITVTHGLAQADAVHSLTSQDPIVLSGGSLSVGGPSHINAAFTISGGTLLLNGSSIDGSGTLLNQGTLTVQGTSAIDVPFTTDVQSILGLQGTNTTLSVA